MLRCPYCGGEISSDQKICRGCGRRIPRVSLQELMKIAKLKRYRARAIANVFIGAGGCALFLFYFRITSFAAVLAAFSIISLGIAFHSHKRFKKAEAEILSRGTPS